MVQKGLKTVPAEPIRRALEGWIAERDRINERYNNWDTSGSAFTGLQQAVWAIFKLDRSLTDKHSTSGERIIYRLLDRREGRKASRFITEVEAYVTPAGRRKFREVTRERLGEPFRQETVSFDLADKILTGLDLWYLWHQDPELAEAYRQVDLQSIDLTEPTCEKTAEQGARLMWETYLEHDGNVNKARKVLGVSARFLNDRLPELRERFEVVEAA